MKNLKNLKQWKKNLPQIAVGLVFALVVGGTVGLIFSRRDFVFEWGWANANGRLEDSAPAELVLAARNYAEEKRKGEACVAKSFGKDDKYLYVAIGCGKFADPHEAPVAGDAAMVPSRFRYSGQRVSSWESPEKGAFENSEHRLFPVVAFERIRYGVPHAEYWSAGAARMKEKSLHP